MTKRKIARTAAAASVLFLMILMTSCSPFGGIAEKLGFDIYDYMGEKVLNVLPADGSEAEMAEDVLKILVTDSLHLETFDSTEDAIALYSDSVLQYMLADGFAKYSGNSELIEKASEQYPGYVITVIIPQSDFEATMYRYFGGDVKIMHGDTARFTYLSRAGAYTTSLMPHGERFSPSVTYIAETERTYRVRFVVRDLKDPSSVSGEYFALIIKRGDGTYYIKKLLDGSSVG